MMSLLPPLRPRDISPRYNVQNGKFAKDHAKAQLEKLEELEKNFERTSPIAAPSFDARKESQEENI